MSNQSGIAFTHCAFTAAAAEHGHGHDHTHAKRREVVVFQVIEVQIAQQQKRERLGRRGGQQRLQ